MTAAESGRPIAIVAHAAFPADPRIRREVDALLEAGHAVDLFALREEGERPSETRPRLRVIRLPVRRRFAGFAGHLAEYIAFTGLAGMRLTTAHRRRNYGLVEVATLPDFLVVATTVLKLAGVPLLLDLHEDMPTFFDDRFARPVLRPVRPLIEVTARGAASMADAIITVHEPLRELSLARGVPPSKISVVMNSADERLFDPARHPRRSFMEDGELRLVHHSSLQRIYGLEVAIEAVARLPAPMPVRLDVYGDGPYQPQLEEAIRRTGTSGRVVLHGRVPLEELPRILAAADVAVVPSLPEPYLHYSLSTKLLESVAMGVPVIASDLATFRAHFSDAAIRYVAGGNPAALAAAISDLADHAEAAAALAAEARRQAEPYAWRTQAAHYLEVVEGLLARSGS